MRDARAVAIWREGWVAGRCMARAANLSLKATFAEGGPGTSNGVTLPFDITGARLLQSPMPTRRGDDVAIGR